MRGARLRDDMWVINSRERESLELRNELDRRSKDRSAGTAACKGRS